MKRFPLFAIKVYLVEETSEAIAEACFLLKNDPIIPGIIGIDGEFLNHSLPYCKWKSRGLFQFRSRTVDEDRRGGFARILSVRFSACLEILIIDVQSQTFSGDKSVKFQN